MRRSVTESSESHAWSVPQKEGNHRLHRFHRFKKTDFQSVKSAKSVVHFPFYFASSRLRGKIFPMKSYEVIRQATDEPGVKAVAAALKVSPALVYKWCEPPAEADDPDQSGAKNPLDRVREMYMLTKDIRLVRWLCNEAGGFYVSNPVPEIRKSRDEVIFTET